jgi:hypothetical protein
VAVAAVAAAQVVVAVAVDAAAPQRSKNHSGKSDCGVPAKPGRHNHFPPCILESPPAIRVSYGNYIVNSFSSS